MLSIECALNLEFGTAVECMVCTIRERLSCIYARAMAVYVYVLMVMDGVCGMCNVVCF